jgi:cell division protein FtsI/penicillin-binding protein 2
MLAAFKRYGLPSELSSRTTDAEWGAALSIGEMGFHTTPGQIVNFVAAVGDGGVFNNESKVERIPIRLMQEGTARELRAALLDAVDHGTGRGIRGRVRGGWRIGGKTGTGPANHHPYDGCFAGLAFDEKGAARYAFATFIFGGGKGGGIAAEVSVDLINFLARD